MSQISDDQRLIFVISPVIVIYVPQASSSHLVCLDGAMYDQKDKRMDEINLADIGRSKGILTNCLRIYESWTFQKVYWKHQYLTDAQD